MTDYLLDSRGCGNAISRGGQGEKVLADAALARIVMVVSGKFTVDRPKLFGLGGGYGSCAICAGGARRFTCAFCAFQ